MLVRSSWKTQIVFAELFKQRLKITQGNAITNANAGRDPFYLIFKIKETKVSGNFFRSKTEWIGLVQPEKFRKDRPTIRGEPLFSVRPVRSGNGTFHLTIPTHSKSQYLAVRCFPCSTYHCSFYELLTADLSVLLVHPCAVTTGL